MACCGCARGAQTLVSRVPIEEMLALGLDDLLDRFVGVLQELDSLVCDMLPAVGSALLAEPLP